MVKSLTLADYRNEVVEAKGNTLLDFWAPGCAPCRALKPVLHDFANESGIKVLTVDVTEEQKIAEAYNVSAVPTLVAVVDGNIVGQATGYQRKANLYELFSNN